MAYTLRHDIEVLAEQKRRLTVRLGSESDPTKISMLIEAIARFDAYTDGYLDLHGSDGAEGTTAYGINGTAFVTELLSEIDA